MNTSPKRCRQCGEPIPAPKKIGRKLYCSPHCVLKSRLVTGAADECWNWPGAATIYGYGLIREFRREHLTHRLSYEVHHGRIPNGLLVCHTCDNPRCINPRHLFLGTHDDNMADKARKGRGYVPSPGLGETHVRAKVTAEDIRSIRQRLHNGETCRMVAAAFGVSRTTISSIKHGYTWAHLE